MESMETLKRMLYREVDEIAQKGEMSAGDLQSIHTLTDTIKNILKIECLNEDEGEYSGGWRASGTYPMNDSYGRHYVRGHYSRNGGYSNARYSRDGYSGSMRYSHDGGDEMEKKIEEMIATGNVSREDENILRRAMELLK